ncbi:hypothetical protein Lal_00024288 [Lupinus albus]|nr:hypothetical protein Lal_00024288 [Lupinus albus]
MPPKNSNKEIDESLLQIFAHKLQENKEQQDARHDAISKALRAIKDKLAGMNTTPPQPPDPPAMASSPTLLTPISQPIHSFPHHNHKLHHLTIPTSVPTLVPTNPCWSPTTQTPETATQPF